MKNTLVKKILSTIALSALVFNFAACAQKPAQTSLSSSDTSASQDSATVSDAQANGYKLASAGGIHIEPITAYSDKYKSVDEIPADAVVAIPNDGTNEYRALRILEENGFIVLDPAAKDSLSASVKDITEYKKSIKIVEIDSAQIIPTKDDYDFFITNTNKALEAGITSAKLFSEGKDSPYANIIAVREEDLDNPAVKALVDALLSEETQQWIADKYNGAVIPVITLGN